MWPSKLQQRNALESTTTTAISPMPQAPQHLSSNPAQSARHLTDSEAEHWSATTSCQHGLDWQQIRLFCGALDHHVPTLGMLSSLPTSCFRHKLCSAHHRPTWQVCLGASVGISRPETLAWFKPDLFTWSLGFLMLSMGLTLTVDNFKEVRGLMVMPLSCQWVALMIRLCCLPAGRLSCCRQLGCCRNCIFKILYAAFASALHPDCPPAPVN